MIALVLGFALAADCPKAADLLDEAGQQVVEMRLERARDSLISIEAALSCGHMVSTEDLARLFTLEAVVEVYSGDSAAAADALSAALRVDPDIDLSAYGQQVQDELVRARSTEAAVGELFLDGELGDAVILLNGVSWRPGEVPSGLHAVQVGLSEDSAAFGRVIFVPAGQVVRLSVPSIAPEPATEPVPVEQPAPTTVEPAESAESTSRFGAVLAVGGHAAIGEALQATAADGRVLTEPGVKVSVPIEAGLELGGSALWARAAVFVSPLLAGSYVYTTEAGPAGWPLGAGGHGSLGAGSDSLSVGALAGLSLPGRIELRALGRTRATDSVDVEVRLGANVVAGRSPEPAAAALVVWHPGAR